MKIKELNIISYGSITNKKIVFSDGMNIVFGGNEAGKTTIRHFIFHMFFGGTTSSSKRTIYKKEFEKYRPWSGNKFEGSMVVNFQGVDYLFQRNFSKGNESFEITNLENGKDSKDIFKVDRSKKIEKVDENFFDLSEDSLMDIFLFSEDLFMGENLSTDLKERITNHISSMSETISLDRIFSNIDNMTFSKTDKDYRRSLDRKIQENLREIRYIEKNEIKNIDIKNLEIYKKEIKNLENNINSIESLSKDYEIDEEEYRSLIQRKITTEEKIKTYDNKEVFSYKNLFIFIQLLLLSFIVISKFKPYVILGGLIFSIVSYIFINKVNKNSKTKSKEDLRILYQELDLIEESLSSYRVKLPIESSISSYLNKKHLLSLEVERILERSRISDQQTKIKVSLLEDNENLSKIIDEIDFKKAMGEKAKDILKDLSENNFNNVSPRLIEDASYFISFITSGKYKKLLVDDQGQISLYDQSQMKIVPLIDLSKGTIGQVYLAYRLSLILNTGVFFPIIIDDGFTLFDDKRLSKSKELLGEISKDYQVLFFTSKKSDLDEFDHLDNIILLGS